VLLDLDAGWLRFYRNGERYGPGFTEGVTGPLVRAVEVRSQQVGGKAGTLAVTVLPDAEAPEGAGRADEPFRERELAQQERERAQQERGRAQERQERTAARARAQQERQKPRQRQLAEPEASAWASAASGGSDPDLAVVHTAKAKV
jgi:hypothetical protein